MTVKALLVSHEGERIEKEIDSDDVGVVIFRENGCFRTFSFTHAIHGVPTFTEVDHNVFEM